ncbi:hypothetical protein CHS0354_006881 [Potamilus streckersoni]|uniref:CMP/dCMP-type deaminase domain-containing protein n=1 Tax=Potamilus streckersoni TaxID=2493646 RepID=A0AAE0TEB3_9BIVA|nr:hypothetical protein CHS0354_006881 [Potamilus streckersoni]
MTHIDFMRRAIELSRQNMRQGAGGPFGAVIVRNGEGWNKVTSSHDPTAHAEVTAIREACRQVKDFSLKDSIIYTSCEPCPMCLAAIYWARIDRIYYANTRQQAADIQFDDSLIYDEIPKPIDRRLIPTEQILNAEALAVFKEWDEKSDKIRY